MSLFAGSFAVLIGCAALAGWAFEIGVLKSIHPDWVAMKPNTAVGLVLIGIATLVASGAFGGRPAANRVGRTGGALAGVLGLFSLLEYVSDWNPGFDQWLFPEVAGAVGTSHLGRMAPETALCFVLVAAALAGTQGPRPWRGALFVSAVAGLLVTTLALAALLCYFTPALGVFGWRGLTVMAVPTAVTFVALGVAVMSTTWQPGVAFWALGRGTTVATACGLSILMFIGLNTSRTQARQRVTALNMAQGEALTRDIARLLDEVSHAQNHTRGFVITGEERYRESMFTATRQGRALLDRLRELAAAQPRWQAGVDRLAAPAREALGWFPQVVAASQTGFGGTARNQTIGHGEDLMQNFRAVVAEVQAGVRISVNQAKREADTAADLADTIIIAGTLVSLAIFFSVLFGLNRAEARRADAASALRTAHERLRRFVDANIVGIVIAKADGGIVEANDYYLRLIGCTREDLEHGRVDWRALTPPEWLPADERAIREMREAGTSVPYEKEYIRRDGTRVAILIANALLPRSDNLIAAFVLDISERKRAVEALSRSEERFRSIFQLVPSSIWEEDWTGVIAMLRELKARGVTDFPAYFAAQPSFVTAALREVKILRVNDATLKIFEADSQAELLGSLATVFATPATQPGFVSELVALAAGRQVFETEMDLRTVQGRLIHVLLSMTFPPPGGQTGTVLVCLMDITERKRAERVLQTSEQEFRTLAEAMPQIVWATRADGWNTYFSRQWVDYTGLSLEESYGHGWNTPFHPDDRQRAWDAWQHATKNCATYSLECRLRRADGTYHWWLIRGVPVRDASGQIIKWFGTCTDIATIKQAEEKIRQLNSELEERVAHRTAALEAANRELEAFAYSVSHDLRAPLRSIDGFSRMLMEDYAGKLDDDGKDSLQRVRAAAQRMAQLIDDMLDLSRVTRAEMHRKRVDLGALARTIADELQRQESQRAVTLTIADGLLADGDPALLRVALENLLHNAWKFTARRDRAHIEIGKAEQDGQAHFFVRDNGAGFDERYAEKLFGAFQRLHDAEEFPGTGIGLATVQRIVRRHGGRVWAKGEVGKGATFYFNLNAAN